MAFLNLATKMETRYNPLLQYYQPLPPLTLQQINIVLNYKINSTFGFTVQCTAVHQIMGEMCLCLRYLQHLLGKYQSLQAGMVLPPKSQLKVNESHQTVGLVGACSLPALPHQEVVKDQSRYLQLYTDTAVSSTQLEHETVQMENSVKPLCMVELHNVSVKRLNWT